MEIDYTCICICCSLWLSIIIEHGFNTDRNANHFIQIIYFLAYLLILEVNKKQNTFEVVVRLILETLCFARFENENMCCVSHV